MGLKAAGPVRVATIARSFDRRFRLVGPFATAFTAPPPLARWICPAQGDGIEASFHPRLERRVGSVAFWSYSNEASHRSPAHFHRSYMRPAKDPILCVHPDANQEPASSADGTAHPALHNEAQPVHQLLLDDVASPRRTLRTCSVVFSS